MRWDPRSVTYLSDLTAEKDRLMASGCTEYLARQLLALERIATQLEEHSAPSGSVPPGTDRWP